MATLTAADFSQQIRTQLKTLLPDLSLDPLTPERKIVDTLADILASSTIDTYVLNYQYDIDTKVGSDLDNFIAIFGFARRAGVKSTGIATYSLQSPSVADIIIPAGSALSTSASSVISAVNFITTATVVLTAGSTTVDAPIQCVQPGALGNVPANSIVVLGGGSANVSGVTNNAATSNGADPESDADLRLRFKNTVLRNISGTKDQFLALAISTVFSNKANVIGPISRFTEYIQIPSSLSTASIINFSKYTYSFDNYLTNGDATNEVFFNPGGVDYTFTNSVPPVITVNNTTNLPVGDVVLLEHAYCSVNSRNDPSNNKLNFVDVFVSGDNATSATETLTFGSTTFSASSGSAYYNLHFQRVHDNTNPIVGNHYQQLLWQPIDTLPSSITINSTDYFENVHYWLVQDVTLNRGSKRAADGIEWAASVGSIISSSTPFTISYTFNQLPLMLNELMDVYKQVTSDVLVHEARLRYFIVNLIAMYTPGFLVSSVNSNITSALTNLLQTQDFGTIIRISDILEISHEVPGVDNIRLALPGDGVSYGIQEVTQDGLLIGTPFTADFELLDADLPVLDGVVVTQRSQNTWS